MSRVEKIIVLMLENRSFDHMLGFLKGHIGKNLAGLTGNESIPTDSLYKGPGRVEMGHVSRFAGDEGYVTEPDPPHEFKDVTLQIFGQNDVPSPPTPKNNGFITSYSAFRDSGGVAMGTTKGKTIMKCFDPLIQLPVLSTLAQNFLLCDHWFSSLPGPTWPNRLFVHAASSGGLIDSPSSLEAVKEELGLSRYGLRTIYENLSFNHDKPYSWKIYYHDFAHALALSNLHDFPDNFQPFSQFLLDTQNDDLPDYSFIEPAYWAFPSHASNDQHPPHDVRSGETLIADVYNALRRIESLWKKSLLIVLYDEHGGFYDHVAPPQAVSPDRYRSTSSDFNFDRLGIRVPAIIVSPYVANAVDTTTYDHTSILATIKKLFKLPRFLTNRDATANTFENRILPNPRNDTPLKLYPHPSTPRLPEVTDDIQSPTRLSSFQRGLMQLANAINISELSKQSKTGGLTIAATQMARFGVKQ
jgi:phospholipase C